MKEMSCLRLMSIQSGNLNEMILLPEQEPTTYAVCGV